MCDTNSFYSFSCPIFLLFFFFFLSHFIFIDCGLRRNKETIRRYKTSNEIASDGNKLLNKCRTVNSFLNSFGLFFGFLVPIHHLPFNADVSFVNTFFPYFSRRCAQKIEVIYLLFDNVKQSISEEKKKRWNPSTQTFNVNR